MKKTKSLFIGEAKKKKIENRIEELRDVVRELSRKIDAATWEMEGLLFEIKQDEERHRFFVDLAHRSLSFRTTVEAVGMEES